MTEEVDPAPDARPAVNAEGVDLTQIRALLRMTPTERARYLMRTVANLKRFKENARRV